MHDTAYRYGQLFFNQYVAGSSNKRVVEVGSQNVNGGLRDIFAIPSTSFVGIDFVAGPGVDVVIKDGYTLPCGDSTQDVVLRSSVLEHCDMFWLLFLDMIRVLRPGGLIYINAPSNGDFHRWPVDCWRFYPDAGKALEKWANYNNHDVVLLESFIGNQDQDIWNDFVAVFCKGTQYTGNYGRILSQIQDFTNGYLYGQTNSNTFLNYDPIPEDRK